MLRLNEVVIHRCINRLYGVALGDLIYDSEIDCGWHSSSSDPVTTIHSSKHCTNCDLFSDEDQCDTSCDTSCDTCSTLSESYDTSTEEDYYVNLFRRKNVVEKQCFGKRDIIFITTDEDNNTYGCYFPERISSKENFSLQMGLFTMTKGLEIVEEKYDFDHIMNCISFPKDCLYCIGDDYDWLYRVYKDGDIMRIVWNSTQRMITSYNRTIMKSAALSRIMVYTVVRKTEDSREQRRPETNLVRVTAKDTQQACNGKETTGCSLWSIALPIFDKL